MSDFSEDSITLDRIPVRAASPSGPSPAAELDSEQEVARIVELLTWLRRRFTAYGDADAIAVAGVIESYLARLSRSGGAGDGGDR